VDLQAELLRRTSVYRQTISLTRLCLDSHHLNHPHSDEYLHLRTFRNLDPIMVKPRPDNSNLRMDMIGDTRRRRNTGLSKVISSRDRASMGNNKVDMDMEYRLVLEEECKLHHL
jgi:hypothetical protein